MKFYTLSLIHFFFKLTFSVLLTWN